jgi:hypothetical protein
MYCSVARNGFCPKNSLLAYQVLLSGSDSPIVLFITCFYQSLMFGTNPFAPQQAFHAFTPEQRATILRHCASIVHAPIDTLERIGGGGVRCTLGELF